MSYFKRRQLSGLGAYSDNEMKLPYCGNLAANSTQICRSEVSQYGSGFGENRGLNLYGQSIPSGPTPQPPAADKPSSGSSALTDLAKIFGALAAAKIASPGQPSSSPYIVPQQAAGISPTTMLIGGGLAITALILLIK